MNLLDITPLQEPNEHQFSIHFASFVKKQMQLLGWKKGDRIAIYRQGMGFFITKNADRITDEDEKFLAGRKMEPAKPDERINYPKEKKGK